MLHKVVSEVIWLTVERKGLSVTAEVEVCNTGAQIINHTLHVVVVEETPRHVQLLYTAQGGKRHGISKG